MGCEARTVAFRRTREWL